MASSNGYAVTVGNGRSGFVAALPPFALSPLTADGGIAADRPQVEEEAASSSQKSTLAAFEGGWLHQDGERISMIFGTELHSRDGSITHIEVKTLNTFSQRTGDGVVHARATSDKLIWSDGRVWTRLLDSAATRAAVEAHALEEPRCPPSSSSTSADRERAPPPPPPPPIGLLGPLSGAAASSSDCQRAFLDESPRKEAAPSNDDELFLDVAPDDGGRPLRPHPAKPLGLMLDPAGADDEFAPLAQQALREEEQWLERKRLTGAVGKLVRYKEGQHPAQDILGLRLTKNGRLTVTALQQEGPASRAGVCAGDQLASIDGRAPVSMGPPNILLETVRPPVALVFLGFAGKLQAEVRVRQPGQPRCGIPDSAEIVGAAPPGMDLNPMLVTEAIVFGRPNGSMFIATGAASTEPRRRNKDEDVMTGHRNFDDDDLFDLGSLAESQSPDQSPRGACDESAGNSGGLYELQRDEAQKLLKRALKLGQGLSQVLRTV